MVDRSPKGQLGDQYSEALLNHDYGSWGPEVLHLLWDGRDGLLTVSSSPTPPLSGPSRWKELETKEFGENDEAMRFAEEYTL